MRASELCIMNYDIVYEGIAMNCGIVQEGIAIMYACDTVMYEHTVAVANRYFV